MAAKLHIVGGYIEERDGYDWEIGPLGELTVKDRSGRKLATYASGEWNWITYFEPLPVSE